MNLVILTKIRFSGLSKKNCLLRSPKNTREIFKKNKKTLRNVLKMYENVLFLSKYFFCKNSNKIETCQRGSSTVVAYGNNIGTCSLKKASSVTFQIC